MYENKGSKVKIIFLIGGLFDCLIVQEFIKKINWNVNIVVINDVGLVVLKGVLCLGFFLNVLLLVFNILR